MAILITGSSGYLGSVIKTELKSDQIITLNRKNSSINTDLSIEIPKITPVSLVIHAAGKAHSVPTNELEKQKFHDVNVIGTENLLMGLERASHLPEAFVFISSVAVYGMEAGCMINEDTPLQAKDVYGKSKIEGEKIIQKWCELHNVKCAILRLPLIAGSNPPGNLKDMINGVKRGYYFNIAGGVAKKSMVLATDVAKIIPVVATIGGVYNLTDGYHPTFEKLSQLIAYQLGKSSPKNLPMFMATLIAKLGDAIGDNAPLNSYKLKKITSDLTFDDTKAQKMLGWKPMPVLNGLNVMG